MDKGKRHRVTQVEAYLKPFFLNGHYFKKTPTSSFPCVLGSSKTKLIIGFLLIFKSIPSSSFVL